MWAQLLSYKPRHPTSTPKLPSVIITSRKHTSANRERDLAQFWAVELFDCGIEGVAVNVDEGLGEVAGELELGDVVICFAEFAAQV